MHLRSRTRSRHQARAVATLSAVPFPCNMPQGIWDRSEGYTGYTVPYSWQYGSHEA